MDPESIELLQTNPMDWVVARKRLLRSGLLNGDPEIVNFVVEDVSHVVGISIAQEWLMNEMGALVESSLREQGWDITKDEIYS